MSAAKLREIQRLRGVAALMGLAFQVAALHPLLPEVARSSWTGADVFFVISGYVVGLSLLRSLPSLEGESSFADALGQARAAIGRFYVRRLFRVVPAALGVLLAARVAGVFAPARWGTADAWRSELFLFFSTGTGYALPLHAFPGQATWVVAVEEHFYLLLPLVFVIWRTTSGRLAACVGLALFSVAARTLDPPAGADAALWSRYASHLRLDSFMPGVALALLGGLPKRPLLLPSRVVRWGIVPIVLAVIMCLPGATPVLAMEHEGPLAVALLSTLLVRYASRDEGLVLGVPGLGRGLEAVGARAYALYLTTSSAVQLDDHARARWRAYATHVPPDSPHPWQRALVTMLFAFVLAEVVHRAVELPFLRLGRRALDAADRRP